MSRLRVLVSNDDGIAAPGIVALVAALGASGLCDVYVSAPMVERSASSHAITLGQHIRAASVTMQGRLGVLWGRDTFVVTAVNRTTYHKAVGVQER